MTKYKMVLHYLGTGYSGWQIQKDRLTVQGALRETIERISGESVSVVGAGRTDSGVHARGQVAHFRLNRPFEPQRLQRALNGILPWDVRVMSLCRVAADFHAQRDALKKRYEYHVYNGSSLSPFLSDRVLQVRRSLNFTAMSQAAALIQGHWDFSGFAAASTQVSSRHRNLSLSIMRRKGRFLRYIAEGDGFLHHMVRNIMGTLLEVGSGRRPFEDMRRILVSGDRKTAGPTAPAHGLYLVKVWYPKS